MVATTEESITSPRRGFFYCLEMHMAETEFEHAAIAVMVAGAFTAILLVQTMILRAVKLMRLEIQNAIMQATDHKVAEALRAMNDQNLIDTLRALSDRGLLEVLKSSANASHMNERELPRISDGDSECFVPRLGRGRLYRQPQSQ